MGPAQEPITPIPIVYTFRLNSNLEQPMLELLGENFQPNLKVWFLDIECETHFRCTTSIVCVVPDVSLFQQFTTGRVSTNQKTIAISVPLNLVRFDDGVIYNTGHEFSYTPESNPQTIY
jgi:hypothetical protein